jgi:hypothetical protein
VANNQGPASDDIFLAFCGLYSHYSQPQEHIQVSTQNLQNQIQPQVLSPAHCGAPRSNHAPQITVKLEGPSRISFPGKLNIQNRTVTQALGRDSPQISSPRAWAKRAKGDNLLDQPLHDHLPGERNNEPQTKGLQF